MPDGTIRFVFATNVLGTNVNILNVRRVIHYGTSCEVEDYVQEVERVGRGKLKFDAILYYRPFHLISCDESMRDYVQNLLKQCRRKHLMTYFKEKCKEVELMHECCNICALKSDCDEESCTSAEPKAPKKVEHCHIQVGSVDSEERDLLLLLKV